MNTTTTTTTAAAHDLKAAKNALAFCLDRINEKTERAKIKRISKWESGLLAYAGELLENAKDALDYCERTNKPFEMSEGLLLNGASSWNDYSWGGCSLIYNGDIAARLATPSEIKRRTSKKWGLSDYANAREHWLDCQGRALFQAARKVLALYKMGLKAAESNNANA